VRNQTRREDAIARRYTEAIAGDLKFVLAFQHIEPLILDPVNMEGRAPIRNSRQFQDGKLISGIDSGQLDANHRPVCATQFARRSAFSGTYHKWL
jgi:hypothetical protein